MLERGERRKERVYIHMKNWAAVEGQNLKSRTKFGEERSEALSGKSVFAEDQARLAAEMAEFDNGSMGTAPLLYRTVGEIALRKHNDTPKKATERVAHETALIKVEAEFRPGWAIAEGLDISEERMDVHENLHNNRIGDKVREVEATISRVEPR
jgi:hypothetical protein